MEGTKHAQTFDLDELMPRPLPFRNSGPGGDGKVYDVRVQAMFGLEDYARLQRLRKGMAAAFAQMNGAKSPAQEEKALHLVRQRLHEIAALLIPGLPRARLAQIPDATWIAFIDWWQAAQGDPYSGQESPNGSHLGEAGAGQTST